MALFLNSFAILAIVAIVFGLLMFLKVLNDPTSSYVDEDEDDEDLPSTAPESPQGRDGTGEGYSKENPDLVD